MINEKEVTIYDIASKLHISPSTVSRSLNNNSLVSKKTRKKVADLAKKMGYQSNTFASSLRRQKTNTIGVIVPKLNSNFVSSVIAGIEEIANKAGYNLIISQSLEKSVKEAANVETLFKSRVDGLIVSLAFDTKDLSHFDSFIKKGIPLIFFDRVGDMKSCTRVVIDNFKAGKEATSHLIKQGCKKIVHITGNLSRNVYADRLEGYRSALSDHGIAYRKSRVIVNDLDEPSAIKAVQEILNMNPLPDGLFIANDSYAAICMQILKDAGFKIPNDMAIVGFNNDLVSRMTEPKLTTIDYPGQEMGEIVAKHLINHLEGMDPLELTNTIIVNSELIVRESSLRKKANNPSK